MQSPSSAVNPSVLSTLFRSRIAHRLAPLPRCATMTRPCAISGATSGRTDAMYSYERPWKPYRWTPLAQMSRGSGTTSATAGCPR